MPNPKKIIITPQARVDMKEILQSVGEYTGSAVSSYKLREEILEKLEHISYFPKSARLNDDGTRQVICRRYRIIYKEYDDRIDVLTIIHSLRKYPLGS